MGSPPRIQGIDDRYRVEREIGRGGMATVFLAHDTKHDRPVAIKVLRPELAAAIGVDRFLSEIRTTAALRHPHILPLHDSCQDARCLYYVMPYVEGESLRARIERERQLPVDEALRIVREVGDALHYAHGRGVIHRDVKPENILLEGGHALLADFGIARAVTAAVKDSEKLTQTGMAVGTPAYMSPEQAAADPDVDARSDQYSLASVLYEMLVGEPPFTGATHEAILLQRFTQTPPHAVAKRPALPLALDRALVRALARNPAERFPSVERFLEAIAAGPSGALAAGDEKSVAVLPFLSMQGGPDSQYFGDGISEEIINALGRLPGLRVAARASAFAFRGRADDLRGIATQLNVRTVLEGSVRQSGNRVRVTAQLVDVDNGFQLWSERYDRELTDIFAIQDEIATAIAHRFEVAAGDAAGAEPLVVAGTTNLQAYDLFLRGRAHLHRRGTFLPQAIQSFEEAARLDPGFAAASAALTRALVLAAFWGVVEPRTVLPRAAEAAARALEADATLPESHAAAGLVAFAVRFDRVEAHRCWERAVTIAPDCDAELRVLRALFDLCYGRGEFARAIAEVRSALVSDPLSASGHAGLAVVHAFRLEAVEARAAADRALELDPDSFYAHWAKLFALSVSGAAEEARAFARDAIRRFGRNPWLMMGPTVLRRPDADTSEATAYYEELVARSRTDYVQPAPLAELAAAIGRPDEAVRWLTHSVDIGDPLVLSFLPHFPDMRPLCTRPDVQALLRRINWEEARAAD